MICFMNFYYQLFTRRGQIAAAKDAKLEMTNFELPNGSDSERILRYFKFGVFYSCNLMFIKHIISIFYLTIESVDGIL